MKNKLRVDDTVTIGGFNGQPLWKEYKITDIRPNKNYASGKCAYVQFGLDEVHCIDLGWLTLVPRT